MDIQKENTKYLASLLANCGATQDEINDLSFDDEVGFFESNRLADWFVSQINFGWRVWQAAKAQAVPKWISVDDELPSEGDLLLGISTTKLAKFNVYQVVALDEFDDCEITHWMHLPQAPKAQEQSHE